MWSGFEGWVSSAPILLIGATIFVLMAAASIVGSQLRRWHDRTARVSAGVSDEAKGPTITAVLTLLALLLGFSFNLAMQRYETRRQLVVDEANAIDTTYLRAQLLPEPHRKRIGDLLIVYTDNRIALATLGARRAPELLAKNDAILTDLWAATSAALGAIDRHPDFSNAFLASMNELINLDTARKNARLIHVPAEIFANLIIYMAVTSALLGYLLSGLQGRLTSLLVLALMAMFLLLVLDIDRPLQGALRESQAPMRQLRASFAARPAPVFDRFKTSAPATPKSAAAP
jgi:hypothetical protein